VLLIKKFIPKLNSQIQYVQIGCSFVLNVFWIYSIIVCVLLFSDVWFCFV